MKRYRGDPMDGELCGWGSCQQRRSDVAPLCRHHLLRAAGIVWEEQKAALDLLAERERQEHEAAPPVEAPPSLVYYYRAHRGIKIGRTIDLANRMAGLMVDRGDVLACEPGDHRKETFRHQQFADLRVPRTEFFRETAELLAHVDEIRGVFGDPWELADTLKRHRAVVLDTA